jgi:hypothetical protein
MSKTEETLLRNLESQSWQNFTWHLIHFSADAVVVLPDAHDVLITTTKSHLCINFCVAEHQLDVFREQVVKSNARFPGERVRGISQTDFPVLVSENGSDGGGTNLLVSCYKFFHH